MQDSTDDSNPSRSSDSSLVQGLNIATEVDVHCTPDIRMEYVDERFLHPLTWVVWESVDFLVETSDAGYNPLGHENCRKLMAAQKSF